jgi:predicted O-methyltransferase YrrM
MNDGWPAPTLQQIYEARCATNSDIHQHLPRLHAEASKAGVRVLELGVRSGHSTAAFLAAADQHGGRVVSVDINTPTVPPEFWTCGLWRFVKGDDLTLTGLVDEPVDVLFIDTSHHYQHTLEELRRFHWEVALDGCILMHDVELKNPEHAPASDPDFPVAAAIEDFLTEFPEWSAEHVSGCYGLAVLRRSLLVAA